MLRRSIDKSALPAVTTTPRSARDTATSPANRRAPPGLRKTVSLDSAATPRHHKDKGGLLNPHSQKATTHTNLATVTGTGTNSATTAAALTRPSSAHDLLESRKVEYATAMRLVEYCVFYCVSSRGSLSMSAVETLALSPLFVGETEIHLARLMDFLEKLVRIAGFVDVPQWFDNVVSRESHALRELISYNLFAAELLLLAMSCGETLLDERESRALFLHLAHAPLSLAVAPPTQRRLTTHTHNAHTQDTHDGDTHNLDTQPLPLQQSQSESESAFVSLSVSSFDVALAPFDKHLSRHALSLAFRLRRSTAKQLKRLNESAHTLKNLQFLLANTHVSLRDFRSKRLRGAELKTIGIVELEQVFVAVLAQYLVLLTEGAEREKEEKTERGREGEEDALRPTRSASFAWTSSDPHSATTATAGAARASPQTSPTLRAVSRKTFRPFRGGAAQGSPSQRREDELDEDDDDDDDSTARRERRAAEQERRAEEDEEQQNALINQDYAQFFDPEERRLLQNLVRHMRQGEAAKTASEYESSEHGPRPQQQQPRYSSLSGLPALGKHGPGNGPGNGRTTVHGAVKPINFERRNSLFRRTLIDNHLKSFSAHVEAQGGAAVAPPSSSVKRTTLGGERSERERERDGRDGGVAHYSAQRQRRHGGLTVEEVVAKNLHNLTRRHSAQQQSSAARPATSSAQYHHHHCERERRPHTSGGGSAGASFALLRTSAAAMTTTIHGGGFSLPAHEKVLESFDNRLDFVRTSITRYR